MMTLTNFSSEPQVKAFRVDLRCSGKSMKSQLYSADREKWLKPVTAQGALQRALRVRRQRHACVQGGASSLGCRGHDHDRPHAGPRVTAGGAHDARNQFGLPVFFFSIVVHAVGNMHVLKGTDDFNVYGYFYVRLYWTGFGFQGNMVEEYVLSSALLHDSVGLMGGQLNLAITGLMLLTVITIHLFQFRFADAEPHTLRSPPTLSIGTQVD